MAKYVIIGKVVSYLEKVPEAKISEIVKDTGLYQPQVSMAIKFLKKHKFILSRTVTTPGKGRFYEIHKLVKSYIEFLKLVDRILEKEKVKKLEEFRRHV